MNAYAWFNMSFVSCKQFVQSMIQKFKACKIFYCFKKVYYSHQGHIYQKYRRTVTLKNVLWFKWAVFYLNTF